MARVAIDEAKLINLADTIRGKTYSAESMDIDEMAAAVSNIEAAPTDEDLTLTGNCMYRFYVGGLDWLLNKYGHRITTNDVTTCSCMFGSSAIEEIPFQINIKDAFSLNSMFNNCSKLKISPKVRGTLDLSLYNSTVESLITGCYCLRDAEDLFTPEMIEGYSTYKVTSAYSCPKLTSFHSCFSLRKVPSWWYKFRLNPESTVYPSSSYCLYNYAFSDCYALDEALNIPVWNCAGAQTGNMFTSTFRSCNRLKNFTFETNQDGSPIVVKWKGQTIDLSSSVGYGNNFLNYNSGITTDKRVQDDATYQALKNDPDWYAHSTVMSAYSIAYSRYNHDSAVATINSLPDTSAYLATAGGTNTIKFFGSAGSLTDGGEIENLTEEEIAVAANKGWTVTLT